MKTTAVLFDMDGVLYDSMPLHAQSWIGAFKDHQVKIPAVAVYEAEGMVDPAAAKFIARHAKAKLSPEDFKRIIKKKKNLFDHSPKPKLIKGAKPLIKYLKEHGYSVCVVTGSSQGKTTARLKKDFGIERRNLVTGKDVSSGKPHPEPFLKALKKLKVAANAAVVIENAPLGIQSAKRAGIKCIALNTGLLKKKELIRNGADIVLKDCGELLQLFKKAIEKK